jgi:putative transposase
VDDNNESVGANLRVRPKINEIIKWFKTMTTNEYMRNVKQKGWKSFSGKLWQRNYYEHIIRNENELNRICNYIMTNPINWISDQENPESSCRVARPCDSTNTKYNLL